MAVNVGGEFYFIVWPLSYSILRAFKFIATVMVSYPAYGKDLINIDD